MVKAQAQAAATSVMFIKSVGFQQIEENDGTIIQQLVMASFNYNSTVNGTTSEKSMSVPFLYIVPIPYLQFDSVSVEFAVKLSAVDKTDTSFAKQTDVEFKFGGGWFVPVSFKASVSTQQSTKTSTKVTRDYSLNVQVHGSQAAMPGGMTRMLDLFEAIITQDAEPVSSK